MRLTQVAPTTAPAQPLESEVPEGFLIPHCVLYASEAGYRTAFAMNPWVDPQVIQDFFVTPSISATWENGTLYQMCYSSRHEIAFVVYACRGGDGPGGWDTVSVMDVETGESQVIRDCRFAQEGTHCTVDLLDLGG